MAIDENDPRLKDMLRAIELGDLPEDLPPDPEDYDDMGGIKSLDRGAPSIKLASEPEDEFELELMSVIREFNDRMQNGELDPSTTVDEYINDYLSRKKMMEDKRAMAAYGGRMQYADGPKDPTYTGNNLEDLPEGLKRDTTTGQGANIKSIEELLKRPKSDAIGMSIFELKKLLEKRKKEKKKLAKGGIAGVL